MSQFIRSRLNLTDASNNLRFQIVQGSSTTLFDFPSILVFEDNTRNVTDVLDHLLRVPIAENNILSLESRLENSEVAIGLESAQVAQGSYAIAIGNGSGAFTQGSTSVAIGPFAGNMYQSESAIAIGLDAGNLYQQSSTIAIGINAGENRQQAFAVAIGTSAGQNTQGTGAVAIGQQAGTSAQGTFSIAIGYQAGFTQQAERSIILNASGMALNTSVTNSFFVNPIRGPITQSNALYYDITSREITYGTAGSGSSPVAYTNLTYASSLTWSLTALINIGRLTLTGNCTLTLSGATDGVSGTLIVIQDGSGGRTITLSGTNQVVNNGAGGISLSVAANRTDILTFVVSNSIIYWTYGNNFT